MSIHIIITSPDNVWNRDRMSIHIIITSPDNVWNRDRMSIHIIITSPDNAPFPVVVVGNDRRRRESAGISRSPSGQSSNVDTQRDGRSSANRRTAAKTAGQVSPLLAPRWYDARQHSARSVGDVSDTPQESSRRPTRTDAPTPTAGAAAPGSTRRGSSARQQGGDGSESGAREDHPGKAVKTSKVMCICRLFLCVTACRVCLTPCAEPRLWCIRLSFMHTPIFYAYA
jgi:hypothetical protein